MAALSTLFLCLRHFLSVFYHLVPFSSLVHPHKNLSCLATDPHTGASMEETIPVPRTAHDPS